MDLFDVKNRNKTLACSRGQKCGLKMWKRMISAALCIILFSTNMMGVLASEVSDDTSMTEIPLIEETGEIVPLTTADDLPEPADDLPESVDDLPESGDDFPESGDQTMETHSVKWISGSTSTVIEGDKLTISPDKNGYNTSSVTAQLNFSFGGEKNMPAGSITIRLPRHIFYNRQGQPAGEVEIPLAKAPAEEGVTGFHYAFDEESDEIVITNFTEIPASYFFNCGIVYKFTPYNVKNGYEHSFRASFEVKMPDEADTIRAVSEQLDVQVKTVIPTPSITKTVQKKFEKWQTEWGGESIRCRRLFLCGLVLI